MPKLYKLRIGYIPCIDDIQLIGKKFHFLMKKLMFFVFLIQAPIFKKYI